MNKEEFVTKWTKYAEQRFYKASDKEKFLDNVMLYADESIKQQNPNKYFDELSKNDFKKTEKMKLKEQQTQQKEQKMDNFEKLNKVLFDELDRLSHPEEGTVMEVEIERAKAIALVANQVLSSVNTQVKAEQIANNKALKLSYGG